MDFGKVLGTLASFFQREGYRYATVGAFGLHAYGLAAGHFRPRSGHRVGRSADARGLPRVARIRDVVPVHPILQHVHVLPDLGRLDFVYVESETGRLLFSGGTTLQLGEHRVPVPRPEHLLAMKVHAMRNDPSRTLREMAEIQFLLSLPSLDEAEIRSYFEQSGLLERYLEIKRFG